MVARMREQVGRFLADEAASETPLRPRENLLERSFGMDDPDDPGGLDLGEFTLRGKIDRIDVAPDGVGAVVRDYKTGRNVTGAPKFKDNGSLQIQLYMLVAQALLGLDVVGGLYQPLGAVKASDRKPRGVVLKGDDRADGLDAGAHRPARRGHLRRGAPGRPRAAPCKRAPSFAAGRSTGRHSNGTCPSTAPSSRSAGSSARSGSPPRTETGTTPSDGAGPHPRAAGRDRGARPRRLPRGRRGHREDPRARRALLRGDRRRRRRGRPDPCLHLHRARGRRAPRPGPALADGARRARPPREGDTERAAAIWARTPARPSAPASPRSTASAGGCSPRTRSRRAWIPASACSTRRRRRGSRAVPSPRRSPS